MANIKSQIKRNRQNDKRRLANRVHRGVARSAVKDARTAIDAGAAESKEELMKAISALDKAAEKGVIHKNNAARRKSRLMKAFAGMKPAEVKVEEPAPVAQPEVEDKPKRASRAKAGTSQVEKPEKKAASPRKKPAAE